MGYVLERLFCHKLKRQHAEGEKKVKNKRHYANLKLSLDILCPCVTYFAKLCRKLRILLT